MVVLPKVVRFVYEWYVTVTKKEASVELFFCSVYFWEKLVLSFPTSSPK